MRTFALVIALFSIGGCVANRQYFRPTERQQGETMHGYPEVLYTLIGPHGQFGEAKVWSVGAYRGPHSETVIQVGMEIHNTSGQPIELKASEVRLEMVRAEPGTLHNVRPSEARDRSFGPGAIGELGLNFVLPPEVAPGEVEGFLLRFRVHNADQVYDQRTPFAAQSRSRAYSPAYGYPYFYCDPIDPFCWQPYGYYYGGYYGPFAYRGYGVPHAGVVIHSRR